MSDVKRYTCREVNEECGACVWIAESDFDLQVDAGMKLFEENERLRARIAALEAELAEWQRMRNEAMAQAQFNRNGWQAALTRIASLEARNEALRAALKWAIAQEALPDWALYAPQAVALTLESFYKDWQAALAAPPSPNSGEGKS